MRTDDTTGTFAPGGEPLQPLFERAGLPSFELPESLVLIYGGTLGLPSSCLFANFVASLDGVVALPGPAESGQIISGRNQADRFVMGLLRACADAVLIGAGTFRKSPGHLWHAEQIYPAAATLFADARQRLGLRARPTLVLVSASGAIDAAQPAVRDAHIITTPRGEAALRGTLPDTTRVSVLDSDRVPLADVLSLLRTDGLQRVLTEGGPALFSELVAAHLVDELFVTSAPALFGRYAGDGRKALSDGLDLAGTRLSLSSVRRHGSHLFLRYSLAQG